MAQAYDVNVLPPLTYLERYQDEMGLIFILDEIGLGNNEQDRIVNDGITTIQELVEHYHYDIKSFKSYLQNLNKIFGTAAGDDRVYFSPKHISELCGCLFYFNHCVNTLHFIPDVMQVDSDFMKQNDVHYNRMIKEVDDEDSDKEDVDLPKLKGKENWTKFRDAFESILSTSIGARGIPLDYLIDDTPRAATHGNVLLAEYETVDLEDEGLFKSSSVHFGEGYKSDNTKLWKRLKSALLNTEPYAHISDYNVSKNGRAAWQALLAMYQGTDYAERLKESAFASLKQAHYRGETKNFTWEKYVNIHKDCHRKLIDAGYNNGRGMDEETKIHHIKANIRAEAGIEHALTIVRTNPAYRTDFASFCSFIATEVDAKSTRLKQLKETTHRVAAVKGGNNPKNGSTRSTKSNKSGDNNSSNRPSKFVDGKMVYGKFYNKKEFGAMTQKQREAVIELKRQYQASVHGNGGQSRPQTHSIKGLAIAVQEDLDTFRDDMESRIVAAVQKASSDNAATTVTTTTFDDSSTIKSNASSKRKAQSGSVGRFLANQRNKQMKND